MKNGWVAEAEAEVREVGVIEFGVWYFVKR